LKKVILITGSEGLIGKELQLLLAKNKRVIIKKADLKLGNDLRYFKECLNLCDGVNEVYNCVGVKGSAKMTKERPADFLVPMLQYNTNMMEAARQCGVDKFLYVSSIAVENLKTDYYPAMAKLMGEKQIDAYRAQNSIKTKFCIVRPANTYGRFDQFYNPNAMVITSLINKAGTTNNNELKVWGDGSPIRDFINSIDVANGMIKCMKVMPEVPINLCSGKGVTIKKAANIIGKISNKKVIFEKKSNVGAKSRVMKINGDIIDWKPNISLKDGLVKVWDWYQIITKIDQSSLPKGRGFLDKTG